MAQGKYWCFTDFELKTDYSFLGAKYLCYGVETCPETGRTHHQGYAEWETNQRIKSLKERGPNSFHWEKRKGNQEQAINYCKGIHQGKTENEIFLEFGEKSGNKQGKRSDIDLVKEMVNDGKSMSDIVDATSSYQAIRHAELILKYKESKRTEPPIVYWYYGPTGTGKSRTAFMEAGEDCWVSMGNLKWWEGYDGHKNVIFDDFRGDFCTLHELLRILDRYEYRIQCKGGSRQLLAENIWITCPYPPWEVYKTNENIAQLLRRIDVILYFDGNEKDEDGMGLGIEVGGNTNPRLPEEDENLKNWIGNLD